MKKITQIIVILGCIVFLFASCCRKVVKKTPVVPQEKKVEKVAPQPKPQPVVEKPAPKPVQKPIVQEKVQPVVKKKKIVLPLFHVVKKGECLWKIAEYKEIYNDPFMWPLIYRANKDKIKDPDLIFPKQVFRIPRDYTEAQKMSAIHFAKTRGPWSLWDGK